MRVMRIVMLVGMVASAVGAGTGIWPYEDGIDTDDSSAPRPFVANASILSSSPVSTILEVSVAVTNAERAAGSGSVCLGLIAIAPTGNVKAAVLEADGAVLSGPAVVEPLEVSQVPASVVRLGRPGILRDLRVVTITVTPCWQSSGVFVLASRLVIEIKNTGGVGTNEKTRPAKAVSPVWERLYRRHVRNYEWLGLPRLTRGTGNRYLVISRSIFDTQTPQFVEWKTRQGYGVEVVTLESLGFSGSSITSNSCMDSTKSRILNAYATWPDGLDFVLLVGDMYTNNLAGSIWSPNFYNYFYDEGLRPHDQWYAFLEGDDTFPDLLLGRFPDANATRMGYQLAKTSAYEMSPFISGTWQKNALMTCKANHYDPEINDQILACKTLVSTNLSAWGMNVTERFQNQAITSQIIPVVNQGLTFYNFRGNWCSPTDWNGSFSIYDVDYVQNTNKLGIWTVLSCQSACFDYDATSTAEALLRLGHSDPSNPKGAVAFIGPQAHTAYQYNNPLDEGIYYAWTDSGATLLGQALLSGKLWMWDHLYDGFDPNRRDCIMKEYTILGDPSLQVWTDVPEATAVTVEPCVIPVGVTTGIAVAVSAEARGPVLDALVCLRKCPDVYVWGYTDAAGLVTLPVTPMDYGDIDVTVTAYNVQPYLGTITAGSAAPRSPENLAAHAMGSDLMLSWSPVTLDLLGGPVTINHYEVFTSIVAHFSVTGMTPIGSPSDTTFVDSGAVGDQLTNHFYRIVAVSPTQGSSAPSAAAGEFDFQGDIP